eukprot:TRINITY_DN13735_c0_g1_i2.p1 TRINITY_DN13735_c0_g1~~TRINITY_DN13735_c0_g1_i2.p1  ORF type:complete len:457 (-),score=57.03 TRINITY_DN13735_c0_g1_i2:12-1307(-)
MADAEIDYEALREAAPRPKWQSADIRRTMQLYCARITCVTVLKIIILCGCVQWVVLYGILSRPLWIPNNPHAGCEANKDKDGGPTKLTYFTHISKAQDCQGLCEDHGDGCEAVDYYEETGWCNLYKEPCIFPEARWDGAASYQVAKPCSVNGTTGTIIAGHCNTSFQLPSFGKVMRTEVPRLLEQPSSWLLTLSIALLYTYLMSPWTRAQCGRYLCFCCKNTLQAGPVEATRVALRALTLPIAVVALWHEFTFLRWGIPVPFWPPGAAWANMRNDERIWICCSVVALIPLTTLFFWIKDRHRLDGTWHCHYVEYQIRGRRILCEGKHVGEVRKMIVGKSSVYRVLLDDKEYFAGLTFDYTLVFAGQDTTRGMRWKLHASDCAVLWVLRACAVVFVVTIAWVMFTVHHEQELIEQCSSSSTTQNRQCKATMM